MITEIRKFSSEPGDGTHYEIVVVGPIDGEFTSRAMGTVTHGYMVHCSNTGHAHLFQPTGFLAPGYVGEKLGCRDRTAEEICKLICQATGRPMPPTGAA